MNKDIIIVGGGIIGLCSAYYLQKEGHRVTVIDQSNMDAGASYINAGYLSPSHIIPLAAPGVMKKGLKWMFDSKSPLFIEPRLDPDFLKWIWAFNRSCNPKHVAKAIPLIRDISVLSQELYDDLKKSKDFRFHYDKKGLFMLCQTEKALEKEIEVAELAKQQGLDVQVLTTDEIKQIEPNATINAIGGIYYLCDFHTTPTEFMEDMKAYLKKVGVQFLVNEKVVDIKLKSAKVVELLTTKQNYSADEYILASGAWTSILSKKLGLSLLMEGGKGYSIDKSKETGISIPAILIERKIAVTPMNGFTRFAGTMEIAGLNSTINKKRVEAIAEGVQQYYPTITLSEEEKASVRSGLRPVTPDGLAYIGKSKKCKNLTVASGHAMMGWSMGTATGKLVSQIISNKKTSLNMELFNPDRKF